MPAQDQPLWRPGAERVAATRVAAFMAQSGLRAAQEFGNYAELWRWSVEHPEDFWSSVWDFCGVAGNRGPTILRDGDRMPGASWFPDAAINYAENLLRYCQPGATEDALVFWGEDKVKRRLSRDELHAQVSRFQQALVAAGVGKGDCVADLRLDDVELAGLGAGLGRHTAALRRQPVRDSGHDHVRLRRRRRHDAFRHLGQVHLRRRKSRS